MSAPWLPPVTVWYSGSFLVYISLISDIFVFMRNLITHKMTADSYYKVWKMHTCFYVAKFHSKSS